MKKIRDFISQNKGFFDLMYEEHHEEYINLFGEIQHLSLDVDFYSIAGNRYASPILNNADLATVLDAILARYYSNWMKIKDALEADYDPLNPYYKITTTEQTTANKNNAKTRNKEKDYIYGFDSVSPSNSDLNKNENKSKNISNGELQSTVEIKGNNGNTLQGEMLLKELDARKFSFIEIVLNDFKNFVTLSIY